jgi:hypothetical protein
MIESTTRKAGPARERRLRTLKQPRRSKPAAKKTIAKRHGEKIVADAEEGRSTEGIAHNIRSQNRKSGSRARARRHPRGISTAAVVKAGPQRALAQSARR